MINKLSFIFALICLASCTVPDKASLKVMNETRTFRKSPVTQTAYGTGKLTHDKLELRTNNSFSYESYIVGTQKAVFYAGTFTKNGDTLVFNFQNNHKDSLWTGQAVIDTAKNEIILISIDSSYNKEMTMIKPK
ncbi:MAG TPA: hypothetical protein VGO21_00305 [Candidatus Paceibacterota bacterium]|jgi:hypothetical protein|nr:hypothetical protein [Candidatus Paceibacterota bacterium]